MSLETNRDLYLAVAALCRQRRPRPRTLEHYLSALLALGEAEQGAAALSPDRFYALLDRAFTARPAPFDDHWRAAYDTLDPGASSFAGWRARLVRQIVDLREMGKTGALRDKHRYFGINAPRGARWYNFDPATYLECGLAGAFGGWEPADDTGRQLVPGEVAVMDASGAVQGVDPADLERPVTEMPRVEWDEFREFLECGQWYE